MSQNHNEKDQVAIITGASSGIGKAIAISLARTGRFVFINYNSNAKAAHQVLDEIKSFGGSGALLGFDVTDSVAALKAVEDVIRQKGRIDILVNNAGVRQDKFLVRMKDEEWHQVMNTNLSGFFNVTRPVVKKMLPKQYGRIVNVSSTSGLTGQTNQVNYSASKAGLIGATKALSREIARRNITVNAIAPGFIETKMVEGLAMDEMIKTIPAGRLGKPEEVAAAVVFLCSQAAGYITGQVIGINGGIC